MARSTLSSESLYMTQITVALTMNTMETTSILMPYQHQEPRRIWLARIFLLRNSQFYAMKSFSLPKARMVEEPFKDSERRFKRGDLVIDSILVYSRYDVMV